MSGKEDFGKGWRLYSLLKVLVLECRNSNYKWVLGVIFFIGRRVGILEWDVKISFFFFLGIYWLGGKSIMMFLVFIVSGE